MIPKTGLTPDMPDADQPLPAKLPDGDIHELAVSAPGVVGMDGEVEIVED